MHSLLPASRACRARTLHGLFPDISIQDISYQLLLYLYLLAGDMVLYMSYLGGENAFLVNWLRQNHFLINI